MSRAQHPIRAAVFVDAENHSDLHISALMQRLRRFDIVERHAFADWRNQCLNRLAEHLTYADFDMHYTWSGSRQGAQKNTADGQMERDIKRVISRHPDIQTVIIVSGDAFFVGIIHWLEQRGKRVIVAANFFRTSKELRNAAHKYLALGKLEQIIRGLDQLERANRYLTFCFVTQKLKVKPADLALLIHKGLVIQEEILRPGRGMRNEIRLNRQAVAVQAALVAAT